MNNNEIIQKIKNDNLKPISRNVFLFKKISIWFLFAIATIFGAYSFALFFLKILLTDFNYWYYFNNSYNLFLIKNIPIMWIILFILSLLLMFYLFKKTNKGYKHSVIYIGLGSIIISFIFGILLAKVLAYQGLIIERFENEKIVKWTRPELGRLSGEVLFVNYDYVLIRDIKDNIWNVDINYLLDNSKQILKEYDMISVIGKYDYENNFTACQIIPLNIDKMRFKPNRLDKFNIQKDQESIFIKEICDFVINGNQ